MDKEINITAPTDEIDSIMATNAPEIKEDFSNQISREALTGGGEMGALMRALDWSATDLGPYEDWPQSLRTAVSICLNSRFPILIWWGSNLVMLYNDAYRQILGVKHPRSMGQRGQECWPEIWDIIGPMLNGVLDEGTATWSENQLLLLNRNGYSEECYFTFSYSPIRDETGKVGGVFTAVTETTATILSERRLDTLRELAAHISDSKIEYEACFTAAEILAAKAVNDMPFALLYLLDEAGQQVRLVGNVGLPAETAASLIESNVEGNFWPLSEVAATGQAALVENLAARFGELFHNISGFEAIEQTLVLPIGQSSQERPTAFLIAGVSPRRALDSDYRAFFGLVAGHIATAISNARSYAEERRRAEALAELDRAKTTFFSNISHELRTPLTLLLGPVEDALQDHESTHALDGVQRGRLEIVQRNALRLLKLVNTLLDFARLEAGRIEATYKPTDLVKLTVELASVFRSAIESAGLGYTVEWSPLPEPAYIDREMWEKIVFNLLSNAFKYTLQGEITLSINPSSDETAAVLAVRDTGIGISPEELPRLFERFHRVQGVTSRSQEGTGIGLALVQELVGLHGGSVEVESSVGQGTCFTVTLPLGKAHLPAERVAVGNQLTSTEISPDAYLEEALRWLPTSTELNNSIQNSSFPAIQNDNNDPTATAFILVADDNADMRDYLKQLLSQRYQVQTVPDGLAALQATQQRLPDLILSDVMMPNLDGFGLLHELRANPQTERVPIILLSARAGEEAAIEGLDAGADDYLVKPFSARELLARVRSNLITTQLREKSLEAQKELNNLKDLFVSIASHELRTPLASVKGFIQVAERSLQKQLAENNNNHKEILELNLRYLSNALHQANRLNQLIGQLLDFSRLQTQQLELNTVSGLDLVSLARRTVEQQSLNITNHKLQVEASVAKLPLKADEVRLEQVLNNLISNAVKYSPPNTPVTIGVEQQDDEAILWVRDEGYGISPEQQASLFDRFYRVRNKQNSRVEGLGLGLYISHEIVKKHGGKIWVDSVPGKGSTFYVSLPLETTAKVVLQ